MSDAQVGQIYQKRWGLEVFYHDFKQTFGKQKLLSRTPEHVRIELHWSLASLTLLLLNARPHQQRVSEGSRPSVENLLRVVNRAIQGHYQTLRSLLEAIQEAVVDRYRLQIKSRRSYPQRKKCTPPGQPSITKPPPALNALAQTTKPLTLTSYG